jgi:Ran GTPase-activating protein (RanGAP) involved in mRNA processing and transport
MIVDSTSLRRDNVANLAEKRDISIANRDMHSPAFTDENWNILAEVFGTTPSLEKLAFSGDNAVAALQNDKVVDALAKNRTIKSLSLWRWTSGSGGNKGAKAVATILKENSTIESVHLGNNDIGVEGAKAISEALKGNTSLRRISLCNNSIGNEGGKAIADALQENTSILRIDLNGNQIGNEGAKVIAD